MDATQRQGLCIGITYAVRHLKSIFIALGGAYRSSWGPEAGGETTPQKCTLPLEDSLVIGNKHEERREGIEKMLKSNDMYTKFSAEIQISGTALGYIYRTDNLIETLVNPAKDGQGDWKPTRSLISKSFNDMEFDLKQVTSASDQVAPRASLPEWIWDAGREQWCYWCSMDRTYKYESGMWLRLDGSRTSLAEEIELAKANGIPLRPLQGSQSNNLSLTAPMKQLTMG
jgi:hypothetical protein